MTRTTRRAGYGFLVLVLVLVLVGCSASRDEKAEVAVAELEQELLLVVDGLELDEVYRVASVPEAGSFAFRRESNPQASHGFVRVDVVPQGSLEAPQGLVPLVDRLASQGYLLTAWDCDLIVLGGFDNEEGGGVWVEGLFGSEVLLFAEKADDFVSLTTGRDALRFVIQVTTDDCRGPRLSRQEAIDEQNADNPGSVVVVESFTR